MCKEKSSGGLYCEQYCAPGTRCAGGDFSFSFDLEAEPLSLQHSEDLLSQKSLLIDKEPQGPERSNCLLFPHLPTCRGCQDTGPRVRLDSHIPRSGC